MGDELGTAWPLIILRASITMHFCHILVAMLVLWGYNPYLLIWLEVKLNI
jgi:hypothetical protein